MYKVRKYSIMFSRGKTNENIIWKFEILEDPRDIRGKKYKLIDILIMTIYGILCGLTDFTNIADFLKIKRRIFHKIIKIRKWDTITWLLIRCILQ